MVVRWDICICLCYKFPTESHSERILKIGQYLVKLWARLRCLRCIRPYLDTKTASTIATSIVHSKLDYCNSLSQPAQVSDHPASTDPELSCTCCCQSSQIQSHHSHPPVSTLAKGNWAHCSSHLPTKFSQPPNLHICITSSQFSLLAVLALHLWSHSLAHPHHLLYE